MRMRTIAAIAGLVCVACVSCVIVRRPLWFDEILGHWTCGLPWPARVLDASDAGVDLQPPGWFLLAHGSEILLGGSDHAARWLALLGVVGAALLLHRVSSERWGEAVGAAAASALVLTQANSFAYDGRPYGLLLGLAAFALFAWLRWIGTSRKRWIVALALSLACAVLVHYYAVLVWVPLAGGELARRVRRGRWDAAVAIALAAGLLPIACLFPHLLRAGEAVRAAPFSRPGMRYLGEHYAYLIDFLAPPLAGLAIAWLVRRGWSGLRARLAAGITAPESVVLLLLLLAPTYAMILALLGSSISHPRYALPATLGMSLLAGLLLRELDLAPRVERAVASLLVIGAVAISALRVVQQPPDAASPLEAIASVAPSGVPIVCADPISGLEAWYYAPRPLRERVRIAADPKLAVQHACPATSDINLDAARGFFALPAARWDELRSERGPFVVVQPEHERCWLPLELAQDGALERSLPAPAGWNARIVEIARAPH